MKKLVTLFTLAIAMVASADVASQNVVGYNTVTIDKKWSIVAINFQLPGGGVLGLQEAVPFVTGMTKGSAIGTADNIQIQNASGAYDTYFMGNGTIGKGSYPATNEKWVKNGDTAPTTVGVSAGSAFWYLRQATNNFSMTVAGQVLNTASSDMPITLAWKHVANAYAADLPLNDGIPYTTGMTKGSAIGTADNIQIQNNSGSYDTYFMGNGTIGKGSYPATDQKWVKNGETAPATNSIPAGKGAWYLRRGGSDFTITIVRPYSL